MLYAYTVDTFLTYQGTLGSFKLAHNSKTAYRRIDRQKFGIWGMYLEVIWVLFDLAPGEVILALACVLSPVKCTIVHYVMCVH